MLEEIKNGVLKPTANDTASLKTRSFFQYRFKYFIVGLVNQGGVLNLKIEQTRLGDSSFFSLKGVRYKADQQLAQQYSLNKIIEKSRMKF